MQTYLPNDGITLESLLLKMSQVPCCSLSLAFILQPSKPEKPAAVAVADVPVAEPSNAATQWEHLGRPEDNYGVHTTISYSDGRYP